MEPNQNTKDHYDRQTAASAELRDRELAQGLEDDAESRHRERLEWLDRYYFEDGRVDATTPAHVIKFLNRRGLISGDGSPSSTPPRPAAA